MAYPAATLNIQPDEKIFNNVYIVVPMSSGYSTRRHFLQNHYENHSIEFFKFPTTLTIEDSYARNDYGTVLRIDYYDEDQDGKKRKTRMKLNLYNHKCIRFEKDEVVIEDVIKHYVSNVLWTIRIPKEDFIRIELSVECIGMNDSAMVKMREEYTKNLTDKDRK